jgi:integrase
MTKPINRLTAVKIKAAAPGKHQDGGGLVLVKTASGGSWVYRYSFAGTRREMGLGSYSELSLADARKARDRWLAVLSEGRDPITDRRRQIAAEKSAMARLDPTLEDAATACFQAIQAGLKGDGERGRWMSPIKTHILPKLGKRRMSDLHQTDIADALRPIWKTKPPTAEKAMQRLGIIWRWAAQAGYPCDPAIVAAARHMLGQVAHAPVGIVATPWRAIPGLYARLDHGTASHDALRLTILTCARTDSIRGMRFDEIAGEVWTVPGARMKSGQPFRYPLPPAAMGIIATRREVIRGDLVFPSSKPGACITEAALLKALNALGEAGRPHGFRTSFRTWAQEMAVSYDVAETVLAHQVGGRVERSYARSDLLDLRRAVMLRWAEYATGQGAVVVAIRA